MLATSVDTPFDSPNYSFEVKWDGLRCLCLLATGRIRLFSRNRREITRLFPELQGIHRSFVITDGLFDGELCVFRDGVPDFHSVQRRNLLETDRAVMRAASEAPAVYVVFDMLRGAGEDTMPLPWSERRRRLEDSWRGADGAVLSEPVHERGRALFAAGAERGLEGIVAKRYDSPYVPGRRTRHWLKVRNEKEIDCVIVGYVRRGVADLASLALGLYRSEDTLGVAPVPKLVYVGNVGTGFTSETRRKLVKLLSTLHTDQLPFDWRHPSSPLPPIIPVAPRLVCRVAYLAFTPAGHLRHAVFRGLRSDRSPIECALPSNRQ